MIQRLNMRACWNWQTGTFEVRVLYDIWVQVPLPAPNKRTVHWAVLLFICYPLIWRIFSYNGILVQMP